MLCQIEEYAWEDQLIFLFVGNIAKEYKLSQFRQKKWTALFQESNFLISNMSLHTSQYLY